MRKACIITLSLLVLTGCAAQKQYTTSKTASTKARNAFNNGVQMAFHGQPDQAILTFERAIQYDQTFIDAHIEWANTKNQLGMLADAERGYEKALAIDSLYEPSVYYSLAIVEFEQHKFEEATEHFTRYLNSGKVSEKRKAIAESYLKNSNFAANAMKNPVTFQPVPIGIGVNTKESEYLPVLTADGNTLIYTAVRAGQEDFFRSKKENGQWQKGEPVVTLNTPNNEGAHSLSAEGSYLVFTACHRREGMGSCDLYYSEFKNGGWTAVKNFGAPVNSAGWESQPSISSDGKTLYFVSERKGGIGGKDIWLSTKQTNGSWSQPENLGAPVNTAMDEQSPFFHADGKTLYFMSNGHPGMGGFDLFLSQKLENGRWSVPLNLGYPINTMANEGALSVSLDGSTAYFATDLLKVQDGVSAFENPQGKGTTDIYSFQLHKAARPIPTTFVKAKVTDAQTRINLQSNVEVVNLNTGIVHASAVSDENGEFLITLPVGNDYALNVAKKAYLFHSEHFALHETSSFEKPFLLEIRLIPIPETAKIPDSDLITNAVVLKNVFFETGSAALLKNSRIELDKLRDFLLQNPGIKIQINGHTDNQGSDEDNLLLSENRAGAVFDYLVQSGIMRERLKYKGFGEQLPIADNATAEGRQQNRRTDFVIIP